MSEAVKSKKMKKEVWDELREMDELLQPIYLYMEASIAEKLHVDIANYVLKRVGTQIQKSVNDNEKELREKIEGLKKYTPRGLQEECFDQLLDISDGNFNEALDSVLALLNNDKKEEEE